MSIMSKINASLKKIKDPVIRERLLMVRASQKEPLRKVADTFGYVHGKVAYWKNRYKQKGLRGLQTKPRSGCPKKMTLEQEKKLRRKIRRHNPKSGWRTTHVRSIIKEQTGITYSSRHTLRIAQSWGLAQLKPRPRYGYSKKDDRVEFIKKQKILSTAIS